MTWGTRISETGWENGASWYNVHGRVVGLEYGCRWPKYRVSEPRKCLCKCPGCGIIGWGRGCKSGNPSPVRSYTRQLVLHKLPPIPGRLYKSIKTGYQCQFINAYLHDHKSSTNTSVITFTAQSPWNRSSTVPASFLSQGNQIGKGSSICQLVLITL